MAIKKIPLHSIHEKLGAKMVEYAGFSMPVWYSSGIKEHLCVRNSVGVFDVSHMGEFSIKGSHALDLIQRITSNDAGKLINGQAQYSCFPNDKGGIIDDLIVYKIEDNNYMLVVNAGNIERDWAWIVRHNTQAAEVENVSEDTCLFAVQGPQATRVLQRLTQIDLSAVPYYHFVSGMFADTPNILMSNTGYTGSGGFELYVPTRYAATVWEALFQAGAAENIQPIGLGARDTLRLEKGFCLYGNDIDDTTSPLEAGLGWITKFTKTFTYSAELKRQKEEGVKRKLIGFKMMDKGIPRHHYEIQDREGNSIGHVTSGALSPLLEVGIGMGYVASEHASPGSEIFILIRNQKLKAAVHALPLA